MEKYIVTIVELNMKTEAELEILADEESDDIELKFVINNREFLVSDYNYLTAYQKLPRGNIKCNKGYC